MSEKHVLDLNFGSMEMRSQIKMCHLKAAVAIALLIVIDTLVF